MYEPTPFPSRDCNCQKSRTDPFTGAWGIESKLHYRLDNVLDEDRSRVRNPNAALVLGMFRRVVVSFAIPWNKKKKKTNKRISTRSFLEQLNADNHRRAFDLVTSKAPSAWKN